MMEEVALTEVADAVPTHKTGETPLPWRTVIVLGIVILSDSISGTVIFPFLGFMVDDFGVARVTTEIGYYAGFLGSSYFVAQIFCSYFYGWLSDRLGRRPVLLFGLCGSTISIIMLGVSRNLYWAIGWRFANGILNGNVGVAKTYMADITDVTNQARGFGCLSLIWNLGNILGPVVGGLLARPHLQSPWNLFIGEDDLLGGRFPYLLPCLVAAACTTIGFVMGLLYLPETLKRSSTPPKHVDSQQASDAEALLDVDSSQSLTDSTESVAAPSSVKTFVAEKTESPCPHKSDNWIIAFFQRQDIVRLLSRRKVAVSVLLYLFLGYADVMWEQVFPLWSLNPPALDGLGFSPFHIGITVAAGSVMLLAYNVLGYPILEARLRPLGCFQLGYAVGIPVIMFYPTVKFLVPFGGVILWVGVLSLTFLVFISISTAFMSVFLLIANSVPNENLSRVNGIAQTGVAIGRTISPILGSTLLAWSLNNGLTFPLNFYFVFLLIAASHAIGAGLSFLLPPSINERAHPSEVVN